MAEIEIDIRGIGETQRAIFAFSEKLGDRVTLLAVRAGANYLRGKLREAEPVKTGRMKRATVVKTSRINRRRKNGIIGVYLTISKGRSRTDPKGAYYAGFVEHGYNKKSKQISVREAINRGIVTEQEHLNRVAEERIRRNFVGPRVRVRYRDTGIGRVEGQHFIRDTFEAHKQEVADLILSAIDQGGRRLLQEINNR